MSNVDLQRINTVIGDRRNVFYWQTDRAVEPAEAGAIWADRHSYFSDEEIVRTVNQYLSNDELEYLEPFVAEAQTNLGNVNSVRTGRLASGQEVIIRCHPKGVVNGYFDAEAVAAAKAKQAGLASYNTLVVHHCQGSQDFAFHVIEKLPGMAIKKWLELHPETEDDLLVEIGRSMAKLHNIEVAGFGPFNNSQAQDGRLVGLHDSLEAAVQAGLNFNLDVLEQEGILTSGQRTKLAALYVNNPLLRLQQAVLVHNDFADWNLLTDGHRVTGILDWDECVAGSPISDIACWSTFFDPERMPHFLEGYWQVASKPANFQEIFELLRLRYVLSKMTLRIRRYSWEQTDSIKERIEAGKKHLAESLKFFAV